MSLLEVYIINWVFCSLMMAYFTSKQLPEARTPLMDLYPNFTLWFIIIFIIISGAFWPMVYVFEIVKRIEKKYS